MTLKCRAANPATCSYHQKNYLTDILYKKFSSESPSVPIEEWKQAVGDILYVLTDPDFQKIGFDDVEITNILNDGSLNRAWGRKESKDKEYNVPVENMYKEVKYLTSGTSFADPKAVNLLDKVRPKANYREKLDHELAQYLVVKGTPVDPKESIYSWADDYYQSHLKECAIVNVSRVKETSWEEFTNTFDTSEDTSVYGVEGDATCRCGRFHGKLRSSGSIGEVLKFVLKD